MERYSKIYDSNTLSYHPLESTPSMYTGELTYTPMGDYGASELDMHSQKGPMYEEYPLKPEILSQISSEVQIAPGWNFYKLVGLVLIIISAGLFFHSSGWFEKYQLQTYGLVIGFFLFLAN